MHATNNIKIVLNVAKIDVPYTITTATLQYFNPLKPELIPTARRVYKSYILFLSLDPYRITKSMDMEMVISY
jgi:hypothetical protein